MEDFDASQIHTLIEQHDVPGVREMIDRDGDAALLSPNLRGETPLQAAARVFANKYFSPRSGKIFWVIATELFGRDLFNEDPFQPIPGTEETLLGLVVRTRDEQLITRMLAYCTSLASGPDGDFNISAAFSATLLSNVLDCNLRVVRSFVDAGILDHYDPHKLGNYFRRVGHTGAFIYFFWHRAGRRDYDYADQLLDRDPERVKEALGLLIESLTPDDLKEFFGFAFTSGHPDLAIEVYQHLDEELKQSVQDLYLHLQADLAGRRDDADVTEPVDADPQSLGQYNFGGRPHGGHAFHAQRTDFASAPIVQAMRSGQEAEAIAMLEQDAAPAYQAENREGDAVPRSILPEAIYRGMYDLSKAILDRYGVSLSDIRPWGLPRRKWISYFIRLFCFLETLDGGQRACFSQILANFVSGTKTHELVERVIAEGQVSRDVTDAVTSILLTREYRRLRVKQLPEKWGTLDLIMAAKSTLRTIARLPVCQQYDLEDIWYSYSVGMSRASKFCFLAMLGFDPTLPLGALVSRYNEDGVLETTDLECAITIARGCHYYLSTVSRFRDSYLRTLAFNRAIPDPKKLRDLLQSVVQLVVSHNLPDWEIRDLMTLLDQLMKEGAWNNQPPSLRSQALREVAHGVDADGMPIDRAVMTEEEIDIARTHAIEPLDNLVIFKLHRHKPAHISYLMASIYLYELEAQNSDND